MRVVRSEWALDRDAYLSNPTLPVSRWCQAANATNPRTMCRIVGRVPRRNAEVIVARSSAAAARLPPPAYTSTALIRTPRSRASASPSSVPHPATSCLWPPFS